MIKALTFGASADYSVAKSALSKYAAACQYVTPEFIVATKLSEAIGKPDGMVYTGSYYHKVTPKMQVRGRSLGAAHRVPTLSSIGTARTCPLPSPQQLRSPDQRARGSPCAHGMRLLPAALPAAAHTLRRGPRRPTTRLAPSRGEVCNLSG